MNNDIIKTEELNKKAEKPENAAAIMKQYEDMIQTKKMLYPQRIMKGKFLKDSRKMKSSSNQSMSFRYTKVLQYLI